MHEDFAGEGEGIYCAHHDKPGHGRFYTIRGEVVWGGRVVYFCGSCGHANPAEEIFEGTECPHGYNLDVGDCHICETEYHS
jgi:hypothetical protein